MDSTPSSEDQDWLDKQSRYIGFRKPEVNHVSEPVDRYAYQRRKAANRLGRSEDLLNDEPDNDAGSGEQAYA